MIFTKKKYLSIFTSVILEKVLVSQPNNDFVVLLVYILNTISILIPYRFKHRYTKGIYISVSSLSLAYLKLYSFLPFDNTHFELIGFAWEE